MINIFTTSINKTFIDSFYKSFNEKFILNEQKQFYIFTNDITHEVFNNENVKGIEVKHEEWPYITLNYYSKIKSLLNELKDDNDLCFFIDMDMEVVEDIGKILLPDEKLYIGVIHPGNIAKSMHQFFENNPESSAYIDVSAIHQASPYIQNCLWGARKKDFKHMINVLVEMIKKDLSSNIISKFHNESYLNKFKINNEKEFSFLTPDFCYPDNCLLPENIEKTIIIKNELIIKNII